MSKQNKDMKNSISNLGKGVLNLLEDDQPVNADNNANTETSDTKQKNSKTVKEIKSKRSFMLKESTVQRLNLLKLCSTDKDLSTIVEDAINKYFEENKKSIEELISIYDKIK